MNKLRARPCQHGRTKSVPFSLKIENSDLRADHSIGHSGLNLPVRPIQIDRRLSKIYRGCGLSLILRAA